MCFYGTKCGEVPVQWTKCYKEPFIYPPPSNILTPIMSMEHSLMTGDTIWVISEFNKDYDLIDDNKRQEN